jgi:hypothetical protein
MRNGMVRWIVAALSVGMLIPARAACQESPVAGVWRGNSTCTVPSSPCQDELNVYRISPISGRPGWFTVAAYKMVDGKEAEMGTGEWHFDAETQALVWEFARGTFRLTLSGKRLDGTLKLPDGTVYRRIHLEKASQ